MGRREKGSGYVEINKNLSTKSKTVYRAKYPTGKTKAGKTQYYTVGANFPTKAKAYYALEEYKKSLLSPTSNEIIFETFLQEYISSYESRLQLSVAADPIKETYFKSILDTVNNFLRPNKKGDGIHTLHNTFALSLFSVFSITREVIISLCDELKNKGLSKSTIQKVLAGIRGAFNMHPEIDNPVVNLKANLGKNTNNSELVFTLEEMKKINKYFSNNFGFEGKAIVFIGDTAIRVGECCALKNCCFTKTGNDISIKISETLSYVSGFLGKDGEKYILRSVKTKKSRRTIPLLSLAEEIVNERRSQPICTNNLPDDFFFGKVSKSGQWTPLDANHVGRIFKKGLKELNIADNRSLHSLRHTKLTNLIMNGVPIENVSMWAGHSSTDFTYRTYISAVEAFTAIKTINILETSELENLKKKYHLEENESELESFKKAKKEYDYLPEKGIVKAYQKIRNDVIKRKIEKEKAITKKEFDSLIGIISSAFHKCPIFMKSIVTQILNIEVNSRDVLVYNEKFDIDTGITDIELTDNKNFHIIFEAKRGWDLPASEQLAEYSLRKDFVNNSVEHKAIVTMSDCSKEYASHKLPFKEVNGVPILHISWKDVYKSAEFALNDSNDEQRNLLLEIQKYLRRIMIIQNTESNMVFVVSLSSKNSDDDSISCIDIIKKHNKYSCPVGVNGWPKEPPNYIGFCFDGKLQSIHHIDDYVVTKNLNDEVQEMPDEVLKNNHFVFNLGPKIAPSIETKFAQLHPNKRVWAMLDTLLTSNTISEATDITIKRQTSLI